MNFKFKLSKRMAQSHACLFFALALGACEIERFLTDPPVDTSDITLHRVASVTVTPASASGTVGQSAQFTAVLKDSAGAVLTGRPVTWSSSVPAVVTVTATGLGTGVSAGSASVMATSEGMQGTASMTVTAAPPPPPPPPPPPATVADLAVTGATDSSVALAFTEVTDGTGQPASYEVRYALPALAWGTANAVARGTCVAPIAGSTIGTGRSCTVVGLAAATTYEFQLIAFRGTVNVDAVFGGLSNVARGTTGAPAPPPPRRRWRR